MFLKICTEEKLLKHLKKPYARRAHREQKDIVTQHLGGLKNTVLANIITMNLLNLK